MDKFEKLKKSQKMWLEQVYYKIDEHNERLKLIEEFLGGRENMKKVVEDAKK
jgi:hypothetical protein